MLRKNQVTIVIPTVIPRSDYSDFHKEMILMLEVEKLRMQLECIVRECGIGLYWIGRCQETGDRDMLRVALNDISDRIIYQLPKLDETEE